jgi:Spy/CpxP family protein refolding chaperone
MRTALVGLGAAAVIGASAAVINGQHAPMAHAEQQSTLRHAMMLHMCEAPGSAGEPNQHFARMADKLALTAEQRARVERVATEACAAMAKYHQQIHDVLTPEQREKLEALHGHGGGHDESVLHAIMKKLHGGR